MEDAVMTQAYEEVDAEGALEVLDPSGHFEVRWGKKKAEVDHAEAMFNDLLKKGYLAFKKRWFGRRGQQASTFDAKAGVYIFEKSDGPQALPTVGGSSAKKDELAPDPANAKKDEPIEVEAQKEDTAKSERFESAKRARDEAVERARAARSEHDQLSGKSRDVRIKRDAAMNERATAAERERLAVGRLEEATKALEVASVQPQAGETSASAPSTAERDAAAIAVAEAKKAHEDAEVALNQIQSDLDALVNDADAARKRRRETDDLVLSKKSEFDAAEKDLKGEFEHEQTRKFDKKAEHVLVPPYRGG